MSDVIAFLESLGRDAGLQRSAITELESLAATAGFTPEMLAALSAANFQQLSELLGARPAMVCSMETPDDDAPDDDDKEDEDDSDDEKCRARGTRALVR